MRPSSQRGRRGAGAWEARALSLSPVSAANLLRDLGPVSLPLQSMEGGAHQWLSNHLQGALSSGQGPWGSGRRHSTAGLMLSLSLPGSLFVRSCVHSFIQLPGQTFTQPLLYTRPDARPWGTMESGSSHLGGGHSLEANAIQSGSVLCWGWTRAVGVRSHATSGRPGTRWMSGLARHRGGDVFCRRRDLQVQRSGG